MAQGTMHTDDELEDFEARQITLDGVTEGGARGGQPARP